VGAEKRKREACLHDIKSAQRTGVMGINVEGDCLNLIRKFQNRDLPDTFVGRLLVRDILSIVESFQFYS